MRQQINVILAFLASIVLVGAAPAAAQRTTATLAGLVVDTSGGALPGATIELVNEDTAVPEQPQVSGATGEFVFNYVPVGKYTLTISLSGFKIHKSTGVQLSAAQNARQRYQLEVGGIEENITVSGESPLVNALSPEQRINIEPLEVKNLPTANRNISNILAVGAGLTKQDAIEGGNGAVRLRLNGLGGSSMSITANGTDASGNAGSRQLSQYNGISKIDVVSIESVGEVQIVKGVIPAEYGMAMAGNLNIITKSGTNASHGSLFHRYEGDALSARAPLLKVEPPSTWNQYGGSYGGPIVRDKAFFFAAFEGYRQSTSIPLSANVPTPLFRQIALGALQYPETRLWLDQYPAPTEPFGPAALTGTFIGPGEKENKDEHVDLRVDYRLRGGNLSTTFTGGHPYLAQASVLPDQMRVWSSLTRRISASYAVARGQWSSETRFGYSYNWLTRTDPWYNTVDPKAPSSADHRGVPRLAFTGLTTPEGEQHERGTLPSYSFEQQMTRVTDRHAFKFGGIYFPFRGGRVNYAAPSDSFQNIDDLINNRAQIALSFPSPESTWSTLNWGVFFQDDWRLNSKLVVNMGVRYDYFGRYVIEPKNASEQAGIVNLDGLLDQSFHFGPQRPLDSIYDDDKGLNLGPRIGFAYNVDGAGHLIINGGWGMMFQPFDTQNFEPSIGNVQLPRSLTYSVQEAAVRGLGWPTYSNDVGAVLLAQGGPPIVGLLIDPQLQAPSAMVNTLGFQRTLGNSRVLEMSYVGTRGYDISLYRTYNQPDRITGLRPNPSLNQASYYDNSQSTNYHSMQVSFRQRPVRHFSYNVNYTWSKALAQAGGDGTPGFIGDSTANVQDFFDVDSEWGPASGDITHLGVGSVIYEIPESNFSKPAARYLLGGWQIAGIFRVATGQPLLVTQSSQISGSRPDVVDFTNAINPNCCGVGNLQYLNRAAFAQVPISAISRQTIRRGNIGNNAFRGPGFKNLDLSLVKSIPFGGARRLELRADMLNALNTTNYRTIQTQITAANFGEVTGTANARAIQLQIRFGF